MIATEDILLIVVAEASSIVRHGLVSVLEPLQTQIMVREVSTLPALEAALQHSQVSVAIVNPMLDTSMDINWLRQNHTNTHFVALISAVVSNRLTQAFEDCIGINDSPDDICCKLQHLLKSKPRRTLYVNNLSQREKEIAAHAIRGMSNKEIARHLRLSVHTIITHRRNIYHKLKVHNTTELAVAALRCGIVSLTDLKG